MAREHKRRGDRSGDQQKAGAEPIDPVSTSVAAVGELDDDGAI